MLTPLQPSYEVLEENYGRKIEGSHDCSIMANSDLVSKTNEHGHPSPINIAEKCNSLAIRGKHSPQTKCSSKTRGLSYIREFLRIGGFSEQAIDIMVSSWRRSTINQYESHFKKWSDFCDRRKVDPMSYNEVNATEFLTEIFMDGKSYNLINTARSALSTFLHNSSGITIGNSPVIKRFMKGVFESRPPSSRYSYIWDVNLVLSYLKNLYPLEDISLKCLTHKLCMLLALTSMQRVQTLQAIEISSIINLKNEIIIPISKLLKQSNQKRKKFSMKLSVYEKDPSICVVTTLKFYLKATDSFRSIDNNQLFISYQKPYKPVSTDTISRWIRTVMEETGIDTKIFKSHSTRAAASSGAKRDDMTVEEILKTAGWNSDSTFKKFYDKIIVDC